MPQPLKSPISDTNSFGGATDDASELAEDNLSYLPTTALLHSALQETYPTAVRLGQKSPTLQFPEDLPNIHVNTAASTASASTSRSSRTPSATATPSTPPPAGSATPSTASSAAPSVAPTVRSGSTAPSAAPSVAPTVRFGSTTPSLTITLDHPRSSLITLHHP